MVTETHLDTRQHYKQTWPESTLGNERFIKQFNCLYTDDNDGHVSASEPLTVNANNTDKCTRS